MANRPIIGLQDTLPEGEFHLPVCIDKADLDELLSDLQYAFLRQGKTTTNAYNRILNALAYLDDPQNAPCNDCADYGGCQEVPALWSTVDYAPNDPRNPEEPVPPNYIDKPWYTIAPGTLSPYQPGDVVTDITKIPSLLDLVGLITETGLPTITIHADGAGEVEIELLKIPTGGYCMITVDDNPLTAQFIPCNSLSISPTKTWWLDAFNEILEGDLFAAEKHEVRLEGSGAHVIRLVALPEIGGETIIGFGFGLRSVTYCGFPDVCEDCEDMSCQDVLDCLEDVPAWQVAEEQATGDGVLNNSEIENITQQGESEREATYDGTPQSIMSGANDAFGYWSQNPGWCEAATAWLQAVFEAKIRQLDQIWGVARIASLLVTGLATLSGGGWLIRSAGAGLMPLNLLATYNRDVMLPLLTDPQIFYYTLRGIVEPNGNKAVSPLGFTQLTANGYEWRDTTYPGMAFMKQWLNAEVLNHPIQGTKNYLLLLQAITTANYHKEVLGDPMWCGVNDGWSMKRGKDFVFTGVKVPTGVMSPINGFITYANGINRDIDIVLSSPREFTVNSFNLGGWSAVHSPVRPTEIKMYSAGVPVYDNANNFPNNSNYYYSMNATGNYLHFKGHYEESGQWTIPAPFSAYNLVVLGSGQPPVGYWTPDA